MANAGLPCEPCFAERTAGATTQALDQQRDFERAIIADVYQAGGGRGLGRLDERGDGLRLGTRRGIRTPRIERAQSGGAKDLGHGQAPGATELARYLAYRRRPGATAEVPLATVIARLPRRRHGAFELCRRCNMRRCG